MEINSNLISENSIGILSIPEIDIYLPIYNYKDIYTSMEKGIAYDTNTGVPGGKKEIVLMGHREQELYKLKNIKKNEKIYLLFSGEIYTYQVTDFEEIKESDYKTVYGNSSEEELRIFTCYPLRKYSVIEGRFLVKAKKISDMNYDVKIT